jgi:hypothetical protein
MPSPEASRRNIAIARAHNPRLCRSWQESTIIKLLIWQQYYVDGEPPTQQEIARKLGIHQSWVSRVYRQSKEAMAELCRNDRVTLTDLQRAQRYRPDPLPKNPVDRSFAGY